MFLYIENERFTSAKVIGTYIFHKSCFDINNIQITDYNMFATAYDMCNIVCRHIA